MGHATRQGYVLDKASLTTAQLSGLRKELTVRPDWAPETSYGPPAPKFQVFLEDDTSVCLPAHYGSCKFGPPSGSTCRVETYPEMAFKGSLNPALHQPRAAAACRAAIAETGGGVLSLSVGMGKTVVALWLACELKVKTLVVVNKKVLLDQWLERIGQFVPGARTGVIQGPTCDTRGCHLVVGMLQSLSQNPYSLPGFGLLVVDECNHIGAPKFSQAMLQMNCPFRLGLSATPDRKDGLTRVILWFLGPIFLRLERDALDVSIDIINFSRCQRFREPVPTSRGKLDFRQVVEVLCDSADRNEALVARLVALDDDRHTLVLSARRPHCEELAGMLRGRGRDAEVYLGGMSREDLHKASQARFVVATYSMAAEGLDIPSLNTLLLATPKRDVVQSCGRIMRGVGGGFSPLIIDVEDAWACTKGQFRSRLAYYRRVGFKLGAAPPTPSAACLF